MAPPISGPARPRVRTRPQLALELLPHFGWGGERRGAGRKTTGDGGISHRRELTLGKATPVHVTLRVRDDVTRLRTRECHGIVAAALRRVLRRADFRVIHFSIQSNHLHLVVEADGAPSLARGMRALSGRIAVGINRLMKRSGPVFVQDRYHAHILRSPREVANAVAYVIGNFASHAARRGEHVPPGFVDAFSSAAAYGPDGCRTPVSEPRSWLLRARGGVAREPEARYVSADYAAAA
jgi:REP element-mobilizing transposase RayT